MLAAHTMPIEDPALRHFIDQSQWVGAPYRLLAGDASFRTYYRVGDPGNHAVLMDARRDKREADPELVHYTPINRLAANVMPFVTVTGLLREAGLSAPSVLASDTDQGLLLLEDLGDRLFSHQLRQNPADELGLYKAAAEVLVQLKSLPAESIALPRYDDAPLCAELSLFCDWFLPQAVGAHKAAALKPEFMSIWREVLNDAELQHNVPVLRDYHADNLLWLPDREGAARVGLLDYQDALLGDAAYDMVSYLEDARRDVSPATVAAVLRHYLNLSGETEDGFMRRYAVLGAQRNCKIIGVFVRLCVRDAKPHYLDYLPRVWRMLEQEMKHPALGRIEEWMDKHIPSEFRGAFTPDASIRPLS